MSWTESPVPMANVGTMNAIPKRSIPERMGEASLEAWKYNGR